MWDRGLTKIFTVFVFFVIFSVNNLKSKENTLRMGSQCHTQVFNAKIKEVCQKTSIYLQGTEKLLRKSLIRLILKLIMVNFTVIFHSFIIVTTVGRVVLDSIRSSTLLVHIVTSRQTLEYTFVKKVNVECPNARYVQ